MFPADLKTWFTSCTQKPRGRKRRAGLLELERLERRDVPAAIAGLTVAEPAPPTVPVPQAAPQMSGSSRGVDYAAISAALVSQAAPQMTILNQRIIAYCQSHLNIRVGGGECAHLATEALRSAWADFTVRDPNFNGDYVWGNPVATITPGRDNSTLRCQPGDIIQFQNVIHIRGGQASQHTAIVAAVDSLGRPTAVYEQNTGKGSGDPDRNTRLHAMAINKNTITSGTVRIYRATGRTVQPGSYNFTLVNNTAAAVSVQLQFGDSNVGSPFTLLQANTPQVNGALPSYVTKSAWWTGSPTPPLNIVVNGQRLTPIGGDSIKDCGGYEIVSVGGQLALRRV